jgi:hypothetical protein
VTVGCSSVWSGSGFIVAAVASVMLRFRRAQGLERKQLEWFASASVGVVLAFVLSGLLPRVFSASASCVPI